jgi:hypothetical protein
MKTNYLIAALLCFTLTTAGFAQNSSNQLFEKYTDTDGVTSVYISKAMFRMMPTVENMGLNLVNMSGKIESLYILTTEKKELIPAMRKEFSQLVRKDHEELMRVRDEGTKVTFYADMKGNLVKDLLMISDAENEFVVMQLLGNFTLQDIQEITKDVAK